LRPKPWAEYPLYRQLLRTMPNYDHYFAQEVRRFFPFGPFLGARVREDFEWHGYKFPKGTLTLLDIYGTHHDARFWPDPDTFYPERFRDREPTPFDLIPQGGGDYGTGHRCAGEWITIESLKLAVNFLAKEVAYEVPPQDLSFSLQRMPTYPKSGVVLEKVRLVGEGARMEVKVDEATKCPFH
jgi:fatty-acid peroxygenase